LLTRAALLVSVFLAAGCGSRQARPVEILAVLPFENLSSDPSADWFSKAGASALASELTPSQSLQVLFAGSRRDAVATRATRLLAPYFTIANGNIELHAALEDAHSKNLARYSITGPAAQGFLPLITVLAKDLGYAALPYGTSDEAAFRHFGEALNTAQYAAFDAATRADPNFGAAWLAWADAALARNDGVTVNQIITATSGRTFDPVTRARLDYISTTTRSDMAGRIQALKSLASLTPADPVTFRSLGDLYFASRDFADAIRCYQTVARLNPGDAAGTNLVGYAHALAGDLEAARQSLREYQKQLGNDDSNALDSLGEVSFWYGDFKAAEQFFLQAFQRNPGAGDGTELLKAAQARLFTGDRDGADAAFARFIAKRDPATAPLTQAQWDFMTGRHKQAIARLEELRTGNLAAYARCQLALWNGTPDACGQFQPAFRLLLTGKYEAALPLLEKLYHGTDPSADGQIRTLLAWAAVEAGHVDRAAPLTRLYPIPLGTGDPLLSSQVFPRFLYLRSIVLKSQGNQEESTRALHLFLQYTPPPEPRA
jgi:tetratricopeptide (TPR) repeat protein